MREDRRPKPRVVKRGGVWGVLWLNAEGFGGSVWHLGSWENAMREALKSRGGRFPR